MPNGAGLRYAGPMSTAGSLTEHLSIPVIVAPMFIISNPEMVIASCRAGLVGSFPSLNPRTLEELEAWIDQIEAGRAAAARELGRPVPPYGVNVVLHPSNPRAEADIGVVCRRRVPLVLTSKGAPGEVFARIHEYGGVVYHDVASARHAEKALAAGADGLIAVCGGAGGHTGTINPFALLGELRALTRKPIVLAGAISTGSDVFTAQVMGASLSYMGTRFIACAESNAADEYREMIVGARSTDIVFTLLHRAPTSLLGPSLVESGIDPDAVRGAELGLPNDMNALRLWKNLWSAGHGAGVIHDAPPLADLAARLVREYHAARKRTAALCQD